MSMVLHHFSDCMISKQCRTTCTRDLHTTRLFPSHQVRRWYACHNFRSHFNYHLITLHSVFHCTTGGLQSPRNLHTWYWVFLFRSHSDGISGLGTPKSYDIPKLISHLVKLNRVKHDPDRGFEFNITKDTVYPYYLMEDTDRDNRHPYLTTGLITSDFARSIGNGDKISDPFKQDRGVSGVRPDLYRINESKILMEHRAGCEIRFADTRDKIWIIWMNNIYFSLSFQLERLRDH